METSLTLRRWLPRLLLDTVGIILVLLLMWPLSRPKELTGTQSILCGNALFLLGLAWGSQQAKKAQTGEPSQTGLISSLPDDSQSPPMTKPAPFSVPQGYRPYGTRRLEIKQ